MQTLKQAIAGFLESNDLDSIVSLIRKDRQVISQLVRIAYDKEALVGWRAIEAIGLAARALAETDHAFFRETIRKLLWSLTDESGGIGWSAPEIIGEIVSADPERFRDIIPLIVEVYDIEERVFRPGVLYALARVAETRPDLVVQYKDLAIRALADEDPYVRVFGIRLASLLRDKIEPEQVSAISQKLKQDKAEVWIYNNGTFSNIQIREYASKLL